MEKNTAEKTNPVMDTARLTLSQLAAAGIREAEDCAQKLGLTQAMENYDVAREKIAPFAVMQEARFQFMNHYFRQANCRNIVDIACGFSPRGMLMARQGYDYLGLDLQAAVAAMSKAAADVNAIVLDTTDLDYISSAGLRTLLIMQKECPETKMQLQNVNPQVMDILEQTGFTTILDVV